MTPPDPRRRPWRSIGVLSLETIQSFLNEGLPQCIISNTFYWCYVGNGDLNYRLRKCASFLELNALA